MDIPYQICFQIRSWIFLIRLFYGTTFFLEVNTFFRSDHGYSLSDRFTVPHIFSLSDFLSDQIYEKKLSDRFTVPYIFSLSDFLSDQIYGNFLSDRFTPLHGTRYFFLVRFVVRSDPGNQLRAYNYYNSILWTIKGLKL